MHDRYDPDLLHTSYNVLVDGSYYNIQVDSTTSTSCDLSSVYASTNKLTLADPHIVGISHFLIHIKYAVERFSNVGLSF
jgi:hypothetical protein